MSAEPVRRIIDAHHHLWGVERGKPYLLDDLRGDIGQDRRIEATVYVECGTGYAPDDVDPLRFVRDTAFALRCADRSRAEPGPLIGAIVGRADLTRGESVADLLAAHVEAARGLFRGVRHGAAWDASLPGPFHHGATPELLGDARFRAGFGSLADFDFSFDAWIYHPQIPELTALACAFPETTIVLDHLGAPLGIRAYAGLRREVFDDWRTSMRALAECANVVVKLGGLAMPLAGHDWHTRGTKASVAEIVAAQHDYHHAAIDLFGPARCMFESNFPMDRVSADYQTLWSAFEQIAVRYTPAERDLLFFETARHVYRISLT
jgi:L-fuconolactonase